MDKVKDLLAPEERKGDEDVLYGGRNAAGTAAPLADAPPLKSPLAQGHIQDTEASGDEVAVSAPADVTGMTGQYITGRDASPIAEQEKKKHGTAVGLASATMASGAVGEQHPST